MTNQAHLEEAARILREAFERLPPDGMVVHRPSIYLDEAIGAWLEVDSKEPPQPPPVAGWSPKVGDWVRAKNVSGLGPFRIASINADGYCCTPDSAWLPAELVPAADYKPHPGEHWIDGLECDECGEEMASPPIYDGMQVECDECHAKYTVSVDEDGDYWTNPREQPQQLRTPEGKEEP